MSEPATPEAISQAAVENALAILGLPKDGLRSVQITLDRVTARYLLREPSRLLTRGVVEVALEIPIRG